MAAVDRAKLRRGPIADDAREAQTDSREAPRGAYPDGGDRCPRCGGLLIPSYDEIICIPCGGETTARHIEIVGKRTFPRPLRKLTNMTEESA